MYYKELEDLRWDQIMAPKVKAFLHSKIPGANYRVYNVLSFLKKHGLTLDEVELEQHLDRHWPFKGGGKRQLNAVIAGFKGNFNPTEIWWLIEK